MPRGLSAGGLIRGRRLVTAAPISGLFLELGKFLRHLVELAFPFRVRLLAFGDLEEHLHQRRHADRLDDRLLDAQANTTAMISASGPAVPGNSETRPATGARINRKTRKVRPQITKASQNAFFRNDL